MNSYYQMETPLVLHADPANPMHAATKQYADSKVEGVDGSRFVSGVIAAGKLPALSGDVGTSVGTNILTLLNSGVGAGVYSSVTVDSKGRVTAGSFTPQNTSNLSWDLVQNKPTTLGGYGIADVVSTVVGDSVASVQMTAVQSTDGAAMVTKGGVDALVASVQLSSVAVGEVVVHPSQSTPTGFLRSNGAILDKATYAALYAVIGDTFTGSGMGYMGQPWRQQYVFNTATHEAALTWTAGTSLPVAIENSKVIVTKNRVYLLGGIVSGAVSAAVYTAPINTDGSLGTWTTATPLPLKTSLAEVIVTKNRVFLIGGQGDPEVGSIIFTAAINNDGTLGTWADTRTLFTTSLTGNGSVTIPAGVTSVSITGKGGTGGSTYNPGQAYSPAISEGYHNPTLFSGANPTGVGSEFGPSGLATYSIPNSVSMAQTQMSVPVQIEVTGGYGYPVGTILQTTGLFFYNNTIDAWVCGGGLVVDGGTLNAGTNIYRYTSYVPASPGQPYIAPSTTYTTGADSTVTLNGQTYPFPGGYGGAATQSTQTATISGATSLNLTYSIAGTGSASISYNLQSGIADIAASLPAAVSQSQAIVTKDRVYLLGGLINGSFSSTVYTAPINADGTLGAWTTSTSLPATVYGSQAIVTKNRVYLMGGYINGSPSSTVYTAPINPDGTLGAWTTSTALPATVTYPQAIVTKDRVYLLGAVINGGTSSTVYTAPINPDGTIGTWSTSTSLPTSVAFSQAIVTSSKVYTFGNSGGTKKEVYQADFAGGTNDYLTLIANNAVNSTTQFKLPDYTSKETNNLYYYIKY